MLETLDAMAVRRWCRVSLEALGRAREEIDALNVYPIPDGDTGTNLFLTMESAAQAAGASGVDEGEKAAARSDASARPAQQPSPKAKSHTRPKTKVRSGARSRSAAEAEGHEDDADADDLATTVRRMAHGALLGARGNSGVILSQLLRGMAEVIAESAATGHGEGKADTVDRGIVDDGGDSPFAAGLTDDADGSGCNGPVLRRSLRHAAELAYAAVARPVEGTVLSVARAAAEAAEAVSSDSLVDVVRAAADGAQVALARTPEQLSVLAEAGVVDAGGRGLCVILDALVSVVTEVSDLSAQSLRVPLPVPRVASGEAGLLSGPAFEVIYLLEAPDEVVPVLRDTLDGLGDSLVVVGGDGLWNVHVHVDDVGAAVEAGIEAGRPYRIQVTHFAAAAARREAGSRAGDEIEGRLEGHAERIGRAIVSVAYGEGLACLFESSGATVVRADIGRKPSTAELLDGIHRARAREVILLPNSSDTHAAAGAAAERAQIEGIRVAVIPTEASVQGVAALAVHEPGRRFDKDVVAMTSAAGAARYGELTFAVREAWTMAGVCQTGDVLGLIDGDVAVIGKDLVATGKAIVERMLSAGGEMVTLVTGQGAEPDLAQRIVQHVRDLHPEVDTVVYSGGQAIYPLYIGVE